MTRHLGRLGVVILAGFVFLAAAANAFADDPRYYWRAHPGLIGQAGAVQDPGGDNGDPQPPVIDPLAATVSQASLASEVAAQSEPFGATGGVAPYSWSGINLPSAVTVSPSGVLQASASGTWTGLSVTVTDSATPPSQATVSFNFAASYPPLVATVSQPSLAYEVGESAAPFAATGGLAPYFWSGVNLPTAVTLSPEGILKATAPGVWGNLQAKVIDSEALPSEKTVTFQLAAAYPPSGLMAWGSNVSGQIGNGTTASAPSPASAGSSGNWSALTAGNAFSCGVLSGQLWCWGKNASGQLGAAIANPTTTPALVDSRSSWGMVSAGNSHACGILSGQLYCWGDNSSGQLGRTGTGIAEVGTASGWQNVSGGASHTCGILSGQLYCWGLAQYGRLGTGNSTNVSVPASVGSNSDWSDVSAGQYHTCGIRSGALYCWGYNLYGQLGIGADTTNQLSPVRVGPYSDWTAISAGSLHTCGIRSGQLYCWGDYASGKLGLGTLSSGVRSPAMVGTYSDWTSVSAGNSHTCGVKATGGLYCWGDRTSGRIGDGGPTSGSQPVPAQVQPAAEWLTVDVGSDHSLGLAAN